MVPYSLFQKGINFNGEIRATACHDLYTQSQKRSTIQIGARRIREVLFQLDKKQLKVFVDLRRKKLKSSMFVIFINKNVF